MFRHGEVIADERDHFLALAGSQHGHRHPREHVGCVAVVQLTLDHGVVVRLALPVIDVVAEQIDVEFQIGLRGNGGGQAQVASAFTVPAPLVLLRQRRAGPAAGSPVVTDP